MRLALEEAQVAHSKGEVPIGSVVVKEGRVVGRGHNQKETLHDPTAHAEILALQDAAHTLGGWRLLGTTLYSTLEPCPMCAGALVQARVERLVYAAPDPKAGAVGSVVDLVREPHFNHQIEVESGVLQEEAEALLEKFFADLRARVEA
ncbi:MAG: nucleoside deaminase [Chloroflexi bacterium]|nr:nucleoside deaminase [Chloroflexota bacterium]